MSDILSGRLDGPADDVYRVKPLDKDSRGNGEHSFADFQKDEEAEEDKEHSDNESRRKKPPVLQDDVLLSEEAMKAAHESPAEDTGKTVQQDADIPTVDEHPGSHIDLQA